MVGQAEHYLIHSQRGRRPSDASTAIGTGSVPTSPRHASAAHQLVYRMPSARRSVGSASAASSQAEEKPVDLLRRQNEELRMKVQVLREEQQHTAELHSQVIATLLRERNELQGKRQASASGALTPTLPMGSYGPIIVGQVRAPSPSPGSVPHFTKMHRPLSVPGSRSGSVIAPGLLAALPTRLASPSVPVAFGAACSIVVPASGFPVRENSLPPPPERAVAGQPMSRAAPPLQSCHSSPPVRVMPPRNFNQANFQSGHGHSVSGASISGASSVIPVSVAMPLTPGKPVAAGTMQRQVRSISPCAHQTAQNAGRFEVGAPPPATSSRCVRPRGTTAQLHTVTPCTSSPQLATANVAPMQTKDGSVKAGEATAAGASRSLLRMLPSPTRSGTAGNFGSTTQSALRQQSSQKVYAPSKISFVPPPRCACCGALQPSASINVPAGAVSPHCVLRG